MDYERTRKYYTDLKAQYPNTTIKYEALGDEIEYYKWEKRCKDADGNWNQDPKHPEIKYPTKSVNNIIREYTREGEKLKSRQMWTGLNGYLDPQPISRVDPEVYIETTFTKRRVQDPKNRDAIITEPSGIGQQIQRYTLDYTPENVDKLYEMADAGGCFFTVSDTRRAISPREVINYEDFRNKKHEDLISPPQVQQQQIQPQANEKPSRR